MITYKKAKDRNLLLNNPPKKETKLKGSKDNDTISNYTKPGEFAPMKLHDEFGRT
jgi:hypothetical protein